MASATVDDVAKTLGRPIVSAEEQDQVQDWINDAGLIISASLGPLNKLNPDLLRLVIKESVARRVRNPDGKQNERLDDYSYGLSAEAAKASLYITDDEWALLSPEGSTQGAFSPTVEPNWWSGGNPRYTSPTTREGWA